MRGVRRTVLRRYRTNLESRSTVPADPTARTLVFAPHQDDETLGCGGTIALKRRAGACVDIVFMADGSRSHPELMEPEPLRILREREAVAAAAMLGVDEDHVLFLRLPETELRKHRAEALERVTKVIESKAADEIYLPYHRDPLDDHLVTAEVVLAALQGHQTGARIYEYPIWLWRTWPWVPLEIGRGRWIRSMWRATFHTWFGLRMLREFTCVVDITSVADVKRHALEQHESQMTRLRPDPRWWTLGEVAGGAFLDNFLQPHEVFRLSVPPHEGRQS